MSRLIANCSHPYRISFVFCEIEQDHESEEEGEGEGDGDEDGEIDGDGKGDVDCRDGKMEIAEIIEIRR